MSPFKPYGPLIALIFVVGVAALKAIIEDRKRHQEDAHLNNSVAHVLESDGATVDDSRKGLRLPGPSLSPLSD